jgi:hypothetical protein
VGDQALVQLAAEHRDGVGVGVVAKPGAGHADLAAAAGLQHPWIELGPTRRWAPGGQQLPPWTRADGLMPKQRWQMRGLEVAAELLAEGIRSLQQELEKLWARAQQTKLQEPNCSE